MKIDLKNQTVSAFTENQTIKFYGPVSSISNVKCKIPVGKVVTCVTLKCHSTSEVEIIFNTTNPKGGKLISKAQSTAGFKIYKYGDEEFLIIGETDARDGDKINFSGIGVLVKAGHSISFYISKIGGAPYLMAKKSGNLPSNYKNKTWQALCLNNSSSH